MQTNTMKKIFILAVAAIAMAACTKSEISRPESSPISFTPNALSTKALILPGADADDVFPATESFNVFAFSALNGTDYDYTHPLMNDVNISNQGGDWKATEGTYLWPATGKVSFFAYHPASMTANFVATDPQHLTFAGVSLGKVIGNQIDPLSACVLAQDAPSKPKVPLVFKHFTSQITATAYDATVTETLKGKIRIKNVVFNNMNTSGDYSEGTTIGKGEWTNVNDVADFIIFNGDEVLAETESYLSAGSFSSSVDNESAFVVIPSDLKTGAGAQSIDVTYSISAYSINGFNYPATPDQTVNIPLYGKVNANRFQNGKRYVFHLGISLDGANNEIMFSPTVSGWETVNIGGITIDAVNAALL